MGFRGRINHVITRGLNHQDIFLTTATGMTFLIDRSGKRPKRRDARSVARDVSETLAAMANADGGTLTLGIENDGTPSGVDYPQDRLGVILCLHVHARAFSPKIKRSVKYA